MTPIDGEFLQPSSNPGIFTGSGMLRESDLDVTTVYEGNNAAKGIHDYLSVSA